MKNKVSTFLILVTAGFFLACTSNSSNPAEIVNNDDELNDAKTIIDSLTQKVAALEEKNLLLAASNNNNEEPKLTRDQAAVQKMVINLRESFNNIHQDKNPDKVLQYFLPAFSTNQVTIDVNNEAEIALFSSEDFKSFLKKQMREKGMSTEVGKITFLDTQIKGEIFTTTFRNSAKVFKNSSLISNRSIISTITGRKQDGWKIGNYSWVSIDYLPE